MLENATPSMQVTSDSSTSLSACCSLRMQAPELSNNVEGLLVAVKATNDFENDMAKRFGGSGADSAADEVPTYPASVQDLGHVPLNMTAANRMTRSHPEVTTWDNE